MEGADRYRSLLRTPSAAIRKETEMSVDGLGIHNHEERHPMTGTVYVLMEHELRGPLEEMHCWGFAAFDEAMVHAEARLAEFDDLEKYRENDCDEDEEDADNDDDRLEWDWHLRRHIGRPPFARFPDYPRIWQIWELEEFSAVDATGREPADATEGA
jgi:hypothetical protein